MYTLRKQNLFHNKLLSSIHWSSYSCFVIEKLLNEPEYKSETTNRTHIHYCHLPPIKLTQQCFLNNDVLPPLPHITLTARQCLSLSPLAVGADIHSDEQDYSSVTRLSRERGVDGEGAHMWIKYLARFSRCFLTQRWSHGSGETKIGGGAALSAFDIKWVY